MVQLADVYMFLCQFSAENDTGVKYEICPGIGSKVGAESRGGMPLACFDSLFPHEVNLDMTLWPWP